MSKNLLKEAEETIYGPREDTYGPPNVNLTRIADQWSLYMKQKYDADVKLDAEDVCWMMTDLKKCRQMHSPKRDNLLDSVGYLALIDRLSEANSASKNQLPPYRAYTETPIETTEATPWLVYNTVIGEQLPDETVIEIKAYSGTTDLHYYYTGFGKTFKELGGFIDGKKMTEYRILR